MPRKWRLFIDEAGNFDDPLDDVVVAGILVARESRAWEPAAIRATLRAAAPTMPWPLHNFFVRRPVAFLLADFAAGVASPSASAAVEALAAEFAPDVESAIGDLRRGRTPRDGSALKRLGRGLRRIDPALENDCDRRARELQAILARYVGGLMAIPTDVGESAASIFAAGEAWRASAVPAGAAAATGGTARYRALLAALLDRVSMCLACAPGGGTGASGPERHHIFVQVLTRDVQDDVLDTPVPLHVRHVDALLEPHLRAGAPVRIKTEEVPRFSDEHAHPALALADFACNRVRNLVRSSRKRLDTLEEEIRMFVGGLVRSCNPPRSNLAAIGDSLDERADRRLWALQLADEDAKRGGEIIHAE